MKKQLCAVALVSALATGPAFADSASTREVVMRHLGGIGQMDVDAIVAPYADDAILVTPDKVYSGPDEIREFFKSFVSEFSQSGVSMETESLVFEGDTALTTWNAESPDNVYEFGADTFVVRDGEIVSHTVAAKIMPK